MDNVENILAGRTTHPVNLKTDWAARLRNVYPEAFTSAWYPWNGIKKTDCRVSKKKKATGNIFGHSSVNNSEWHEILPYLQVDKLVSHIGINAGRR